ncbi:glycosyltransferase family 61 protein [Kordiimonas marina]|uniref:glycosyltransferase family 61 protein n=1 Tax=Kordiimonas marina TaxID=2872312 RepID=UPI001FF3DF17|nr:glycosyltransferase family 61 protein [Kordiimonas marina]MCJ9428674.1 glycosyltransferase family 61 protein [Kordiimonas marina]
MTDRRFTVDYAPHAENLHAALEENGLHFSAYTDYYDRRIRPERRFNENLALTDDAYTSAWLERYFDFQSRGTDRLGLLHAKDCWVTNEWGLVVMAASSLAVSGMYGFGWMDRHFDILESTGDVARDAGGFTLTPMKDGAERQVLQLEGTSALLSFPGALTYGHWIVDVAGRMELLNALTDMNRINHFLLPKVAGWMRPFLVAYGILPDRIIELDSAHVYEPEELILPTTLSHQPGGGLPIAFSRLVFRRLAALARQWGKRKKDQTPAPKPGGLVFMDHKRMTAAPGRELRNASAVRDMILRMGGRTVDPLALSLAELTEALSGARLVVGEDSSALHNIIFAPAPVLVIETSRQNLLHGAIQEACRRKVAFFQADEKPGGWYADTDRLKTVIKGILGV